MALKNVKANVSGGKRHSRWVTRAEAKDGARQIRRSDDRAQAVVAGEYEPRHVTKAVLAKLYEMYHLSNSALAGKQPSKHDRMLWACKAIREEHPEVSETGAYKDLSNSMA